MQGYNMPHPEFSYAQEVLIGRLFFIFQISKNESPLFTFPAIDRHFTPWL